MGKGRLFSDSSNDEVYNTQISNETYVLSSQQNAQGLGGGVFNDSSGYGNFRQSGRDQRNADLNGALFRGNLGFNLDTAVLDVATSTLNILEDASGNPLSQVSIDKSVTISAGSTADLITILGAQRPGQRLRIYNTEGKTITIKNTGSAISDTIFTPGATDFVLTGNEVVDLTYDIIQSKWRVVGGAGGGTPGISFPILYPKVDLTPAISFNQTIDLSVDTGNAKQIQFPAGDIGLQIIGDPVNTVGEDVYVLFIQDSVGGRSLSTVDSAIKNGSLMDALLDKDANARTLFRLATLDGGISYHATLVDLKTAAGGSLSTLAIDTNKDWEGRFITNIAGFDLFANSVANNITNMGGISFVSDGAVIRGQFGRSEFFLPTVVPDGLVTNIENTQNITWTIDGTEKFQLDGSSGGKLIANVDLDMSTFDILNIDNARFFADSTIFPTDIDKSIILLNTGNQFQFNTSESNNFIFSFDNNAGVIFDHDTVTPSRILTVQSDSTDINSIARLNLTRAREPAVSLQIIGQIGFRAPNDTDAGTLEYTAIEGKIEDATKNSIDGSLSFQITKNNSSGIQFMTMNLGNDNAVKLFKTINMNSNIINTTKHIEFNNSLEFTAVGAAIGFDASENALKYHAPLDLSFHKFEINGQLMASIFRDGANSGTLQVDNVIGDKLLQANERIDLSTFTNASPTNGNIWLDTTSGLFQFRQNAVTVGLGGSGISFPVIPPVNVLGTVSTNQNIDLSLTTAHSTSLTLGANIDITFSNFPATSNQIEWEIEVTQDASTAFVITWPVAVVNPPDPSTYATLGSVTVIVFRTNDGGTTIRVANTVTTTTGGVVGPSGGSTDNAIVRFDGTTGKLIKNSTVTITPAGELNNVTRINQIGTVPTSGFLNLANSSTIAWEASPAGTDGTLTFSSDERFLFSDNAIVGTTSGGLTLGADTVRIGTLFVNAIDAATTLDVVGTTSLKGATTFIGDADADVIKFRGEIDIVEIAEPTTPASNDLLTLYVDSADGITKVKKFGGAVVSLEAGGAGGDVVGPSGGSTDNAIVRFDGTTGKLIADSDITINPAGQLNNVTRINQAGTIPISGFINMANSATLAWEASPAGADGTLTFSSNERFVFSNNVLVPTTNAGGGLGLETVRWNTLWATAVDLTGSLQVDGNANLNGNTNIGNASSDTLSVTASIDTDLVPTGTRDLGELSNQWQDLWIDGTANIDTLTNSASIIVTADLDFDFNSTIDWNQTTSGANSSTQTLPANPEGFLVIKVNGVSKRVPFYPA